MDIVDFVRRYGRYTFDQKPFCEVDNVIFSQIVYVGFEDVIDNFTGMTLENACKKYYEIHSEKEIENLISISSKAVALMKECSKVKRYKDIVVCNYVNYVNDAIDKQFAAVNFVLNDREDIVVSFRGTDVTVTGLKESAMLSYMFPVPAQIEALHYFQETAMMYKGDVRVVGHSKGGNLAVFAAVNCSNKLKKQIVGVYQNDAPGFPKHFFNRYDYNQIKDRIYLYTPQSSIIGRMLYHDVEPHIVVSSNIGGIRQHQVSSWIVEKDKFETTDKYEAASDFACEYFNNLIDYISDDDLEMFLDVLEHVASEMGIDDFYDLKYANFKKAFKSIEGIKFITEEQKDFIKDIIKVVLTDFTKDFVESKAKNFFDKHIANKGKDDNDE